MTDACSCHANSMIPENHVVDTSGTHIKQTFVFMEPCIEHTTYVNHLKRASFGHAHELTWSAASWGDMLLARANQTCAASVGSNMPPRTAKPPNTPPKTASSGSSNWTAKNASRTASRESVRAEVLFRQRVSVSTQTEQSVSLATQTDVTGDMFASLVLPALQLTAAPVTPRAAPLISASPLRPAVAARLRPLPVSVQVPKRIPSSWG